MENLEREVKIAREQLASSKCWYISKLTEWYKFTYAIDSDFQDICNYKDDITFKAAYFFNGVDKYKKPIFILIFDNTIKGAVAQVKKLEKRTGFYYYYFYDKVITFNNISYQFEGGTYNAK